MHRETRGFGNPVLDEMIAHEQHLTHKKRVRQAVGPVAQSLDSQHLRKLNRDKAWQLEEVRVNEIEAQNKKLFLKLKSINETSPSKKAANDLDTDRRPQ